MNAVELNRFIEHIRNKFYSNISGSELHFVAAAKIAGEVGELIEELNGWHGYKPVKGHAYGLNAVVDEMADVFVALAMLANILEVDLEEIIKSKLDKNFNNRLLYNE